MFLEEYEAVRLVDYLRLPQIEAAERMGVSRPTFTRIYDQAKIKLAQALVEGLTLQISGGHAQFDTPWFRCDDCSTTFTPAEVALYVNECPVCRSVKIRRLIGDAAKDSVNVMLRNVLHQTGYCQCPGCGLKISRQAGVQCSSLVCSGCGSKMIREYYPL